MTIVGAPTKDAPAKPDPNSVAQWEHMRNLGPTEYPPDFCPTFDHRINATLVALKWCWMQRLATADPPNVLDVGAGSAMIGRKGAEWVAANELPIFHIGMTEQSAVLCRWIKQAVPDASVAEWRYDPGGVSLKTALGEAKDTFLRQYFTVLASHILEHVGDVYGFLDECWSLVEPGGFLVVVVPKMDEHRTHVNGMWDWDRTMAVLRQYVPYGQPLVAWEYGNYGDVLIAVPKSHDEAVPVAKPEPPKPAPPQNGKWETGGIELSTEVNPNTYNARPFDEYLSPPPKR